MKKFRILFVFFIGLSFLQCQERGDRLIERPVYGLQNTTTLEIDKIQLTDSATVLYVDAYFYPNYWIRIDSGTYIVAQGKKYFITGSENIVLNDEHWMPDSGEDHFKLIFPPIPRSTKTIDFIESDCDDCFKIWDIDLTGKVKEYKPDLPEEILSYQPDMSFKLEEPEMKIGKTKVTLTVTGVHDGYAFTPRMITYNPFTREQTDTEGKNEGNGKYIFEVDLYATGPAYLLVGVGFQEMVLDPGEEAEAFFDLTAYSKKQSRYHAQPDIIYAGFKGKYGELNNQLLRTGDQQKAYEIDTQGDYSLLDKDAKGFVEAMLQKYNEKLDEINKADLSEALKQIAQAELKSSLVNPILQMPRVYESIYRRQNNLGWEQPVEKKFPNVTDKELLSLKRIDLNDPYWLYSTSFSYTAPSLAETVSSDEIFNEIAGSNHQFLQDLRKSIPAMSKATSREPLSATLEKALNSTSTPHYASVFKHVAEKTQRQYEEALRQGGFTVVPTPEVDGEKILESIVANYKGKALFVDFWATWCGPCLNAMKTIKPFKPEMVDKGVLTIYISNASSPYAKWIGMLPDIGGLHYYLDEKQWDKLSNKYDIQGIPTYMIFDKKGNKAFEATGYPGNDKIKEELAKVW